MVLITLTDIRYSDLEKDSLHKFGILPNDYSHHETVYDYIPLENYSFPLGKWYPDYTNEENYYNQVSL
jgi:hypothetical protein